MNTLRLGSLLVAATAFAGCGQQYFSAMPSAGSAAPDARGARGTRPPGCTETIQSTTRTLRILFALDNSNSTNNTDAGKAMRLRTLEDYLRDHGSRANLSYFFSLFR